MWREYLENKLRNPGIAALKKVMRQRTGNAGLIGNANVVFGYHTKNTCETEQWKKVIFKNSLKPIKIDSVKPSKG